MEVLELDNFQNEKGTDSIFVCRDQFNTLDTYVSENTYVLIADKFLGYIYLYKMDDEEDWLTLSQNFSKLIDLNLIYFYKNTKSFIYKRTGKMLTYEKFVKGNYTI